MLGKNLKFPNLLAAGVLLTFAVSLHAQNEDYNYDFGVSDEDLDETNNFEETTSNSNSVTDFPAANEEEFNYGGVEDFTDEEKLFEDNTSEGELNFGDEEPVGEKMSPPAEQPKSNKSAKNKKKKKKTDNKNTEVNTEPVNAGPVEATPEETPATAADSLDGGTLVDPFEANPISDENQTAPVQDNSVETVGESPYAPLPEDSMAPPAPNLPEPNEFAGAPTVPGTRRLMAVGEAPEKYRVRAGDTLYDISDQLLDEPNYWPKLWALNPEIRNPHFIYPGIELRFYPGDDDAPPYLQVVREDDIVPIEKNGLDEAELISQEMANVLFDRFIPRVSPVEDAADSQIESFGVDQVGGRPQGKSVGVVVPAFYFAEEQEPLATVVGNREGWSLSSDNEYFIVESETGLSAGTIYSLVRATEVPIIEKMDDEVGYRYEFAAAAKITRQLEEGFYEAKVIYARLGVRSGDQVLKYKSFRRTVSIDETTVSGSGNGFVIGFEHSGQRMGAQGSLVFLSGSYSSNSIVPVYNDVDTLLLNRYSPDIPEETSRPVATIKVIESGSQASLGYIINSIRAVRIGDYTGKG